jgi:hypothetical protein
LRLQASEGEAQQAANAGILPVSIILRSIAPELSNNIIQKSLAFGCDWSGSVGIRAASKHGG